MKKVGGLGSGLSALSGLSAMGIGGGGGAPWTPASPTTDGGVLPHTWLYPAAGLWQDSAKTIAADEDGDPVGGWVNQGSDSYDVIQATTAQKPTLKLAIQNGQAVLRFDGGDSLLATAFGGGSISQPNTVFIVAQLNSPPQGQTTTTIALDGDTSTTRHNFRQDGSSGQWRWAIYAGSNVINTTTDTNWNIFTLLYNGASSEGWRNGTSILSGDCGAQALDGITVGARYGSSGSEWDGDESEILIYDSNLSDADKNQVATYLSTKYNISYTDIT